MSIKHLEEYRDPELARRLITRIHHIRTKPVRLMEVCGTHTVSIFRSGMRSVLPPDISLVSGPGCPVCVTDQSEIDAFIAISRMNGVIVTTFGDLIRVPGTESSLQAERAGGRDIRMVYSPMDAVDIARAHPDKRVVFLGVGFETTAPTIAATLMAAKASGLSNFLLYSAHKTVPPALDALVNAPDVLIDGLILPGHVSVIIGSDAYLFLKTVHHLPSVIAGFEPADILQAVYLLVSQIHAGMPELDNAYPRAVTSTGNPKALSIMNAVFEPVDATWRGIGTIPSSGLKIREEYADMDAARQLDIRIPEPVIARSCACGDILKGIKTPPECALYKKRCTPVNPVGPCMVSSEGTCAAYYRYQ
jgi:hydrogenase expression/formation protein HypD